MKVDESHERFVEVRFEAWLQAAIKFFVLANSGAAIALLSFLGARSESGSFAAFAIIALACFVVGVIVAGIAIMGQLTGAYRKYLSVYVPGAEDFSIKKSWRTRYFDKAEPLTAHLMVLAFGLFVLGCLLGLIGLAVAV